MIRLVTDDNGTVYCFRFGDPLFAAVERLVLDAEATNDGDKEPKVSQQVPNSRPGIELQTKKTQ